MKLRLHVFLMTFSTFSCLSGQVVYPGDNPGNASIISKNSQVVIENNILKMTLTNDGKRIKITGFEDKISHDKVLSDPVPLFELFLADSSLISSDDFILKKPAEITDIKGDPDLTNFDDKLSGGKYSAYFWNPKSGLSLHWEAVLSNGSNYIQQSFRFEGGSVNKLTAAVLLKLPLKKGMRTEGIVDGSPVLYKNMFFALEYPLSKVQLKSGFISASIPRLNESNTVVWGVTPAGQMRRGFLYYVERERAHPYHQVLHYNSWYDISWGTRKFTEDECLDRIKWFGDSLVRKRHVQLNSFLFDDGWDDNKTLWKFHQGFPEGFTNLKEKARQYNAEIGVWLSPFGGYGEPKSSRIVYGNRQKPPFETNEQGFSLSGPVYYKRFREVTSDFIKNYDVSMFKFDGVGTGNGAGIVYQKDVEAFLRLMNDLRKLKPEIYISMTTGTWPSVYWLFYGDNIWRGGDDTNVMGEGTERQKWITYRDADTYKNVVKRGPLYPLNSLMLCGICIAEFGLPASFEMNDQDISDEIWSFFATGTNLQELYVNPHKLNSANWDCLAKAAEWAKENEKVLTDVHWTGGDPSKGEVYGFAAWSAEKGTLSLRNPSSVEKQIEIIVENVFELPATATDKYSFYDAMSADDSQPSFSGKSFTLKLKPFEVRIFNTLPE
jgi:hypothetical protein